MQVASTKKDSRMTKDKRLSFKKEILSLEQQFAVATPNVDSAFLSSARIKSPMLHGSPLPEFQSIREDEGECEQPMNRDLELQAEFEELPLNSARTMELVFQEL